MNEKQLSADGWKAVQIQSSRRDTITARRAASPGASRISPQKRLHLPQANFVLYGLHQMLVDLGGEFLGGVVAHAALAVVHGGHLQDHGQISARGDGDGV